MDYAIASDARYRLDGFHVYAYSGRRVARLTCEVRLLRQTFPSRAQQVAAQSISYRYIALRQLSQPVKTTFQRPVIHHGKLLPHTSNVPPFLPLTSSSRPTSSAPNNNSKRCRTNTSAPGMRTPRGTNGRPTSCATRTLRSRAIRV